MKPRITPNTARAFSLLEVLVALALLGILLGSVYVFVTTLFDRESRALDEADRSQVATMVFDRLEADLMTAIASTGGGIGIEGDANRVRIAHQSVLLGSPDAPSHDLQTTTIRFDKRSGRLVLERVSGDVEQSGRSSAEAYPVPVRRAAFRYHDGASWRDRFSSTRSMPAAIELAIWFGDPTDPDSESSQSESLNGQGTGFGQTDTRMNNGDPYFGNQGAAGAFADDPFGADSSGVEFNEWSEEPEDLGQPDRVRMITIPDAQIPRFVRRQLDAGSRP